MEFRLEVGLLRRKITIFRELATGSIWHAANLLSRPEAYSSGSPADFEFIADKCGPADTCSISQLKIDPKVKKGALKQVEEVLSNYERLTNLESAIHRAMAASS